MKSTKEVRPSFVTFILKSDAQRQTPFQGGNAMSMTTNGIGNNPAMDSRAAYDYAAAMQKAHIETAATSEAGKNKPPVKKMEPKPVQTYSSIELRYDMNEQLDQVVVTVVDPSTNKVIKEIPSAEVQEMRIRVKDAIGSFIDETR